MTGYNEFRQLVLAHARKHYGLMVIVGPPGVAKSEIVERTMRQVHGSGRWALIRGRHSSLDLYRRLYEHRLNPIVLDDLDGLLRESSNTALLKAACHTRRVKRIQWGLFHRAFSGPDSLPMSFESIRRLTPIGNTWDAMNALLKSG